MVQQKTAVVAEPVKKRTLVVAAQPLRYGQRISEDRVKLIEWSGDIPEGGFETVAAMGLSDDGPYALGTIAPGSPIFKAVITAPGQKPSLSSRLVKDEVAMTIPVNTITGVAGFVLPEERVDVILNRKKDARRFADVILQNVRVLAVNSIPDAGTGEPVQAKSVTFAASREDAQKLLVASGLGEISLVLRSPMSKSFQPATGVSDLQIVSSEPPAAAAEPSAPQPPTQESTAEKTRAPVAERSAPNTPPARSQITVIRGLSSSVVAVP